MKKIAAIVVACALIMAISSAAAQAAGSWPFQAATYPVSLKGEATNIHALEIAGATLTCRKGTFNTAEEGAPNPTGPQETLEVHPIYSECKLLLAGVDPAKVLTGGCNYVFHSAAPSTKRGSMDIVCNAVSEIEVFDESISGCTIKIGSQTGLKAVEYFDQSAGTVKVNFELGEPSGFRYTATSICGLAINEGRSGVYREGEEPSGVPRAAPKGHPASVVLKGFNQLSEADAVAVASAPHWYSNGTKLPLGEKTNTIGWGTLTLESSAGSTACHSAQAGNDENTEAPACRKRSCSPPGNAKRSGANAPVAKRG
jgi:hypothetical protein